MIIVLKRPVSYWRARNGRPAVNPMTGRQWPHYYRLYDTDTRCRAKANSRGQRIGPWLAHTWQGLEYHRQTHWVIVGPPGGDIMTPEGL